MYSGAAKKLFEMPIGLISANALAVKIPRQYTFLLYFKCKITSKLPNTWKHCQDNLV